MKENVSQFHERPPMLMGCILALVVHLKNTAADHISIANIITYLSKKVKKKSKFYFLFRMTIFRVAVKSPAVRL